MTVTVPADPARYSSPQAGKGALVAKTRVTRRRVLAGAAGFAGLTAAATGVYAAENRAARLGRHPLRG